MNRETKAAQAVRAAGTAAHGAGVVTSPWRPPILTHCERERKSKFIREGGRLHGKAAHVFP